MFTIYEFAPGCLDSPTTTPTWPTSGAAAARSCSGKAWSVPVIRHLLSPLKEYFRSSTTIEEGLGHVRPTGTSHRGAGWYVANGVNGISSPSGSRVISDMSSSSAVSKKK